MTATHVRREPEDGRSGGIVSDQNSTVRAGISSGSGFWARLFDFSFSSFVTQMIIRAIYIVGFLLAFITAVIAAFVSWYDQGFWAFIWTVIFAPVWLVVVAVMLRVWCEILIAVFRIAQTSIEVAKNTGTRL